MLAATGRVQREGAVVHVIAGALTDLSPLLRSVGEHHNASLSQGRRGWANQAGNPDLRSHPQVRERTRDFR